MESTEQAPVKKQIITKCSAGASVFGSMMKQSVSYWYQEKGDTKNRTEFLIKW